MSRVKDLEIRGIRNFGDENTKARIHFSKPLTLILGPNGTGKTTIIESLKYATSGEYPPDSDRGKSFVHEPKSTQNHTVKGQVKGKIVDKNGREFTVTRTMQVSRMKTGVLKFQALDNTMTRLDERTGEKVQITSRCSDVDREMLNAMGVSKPILNYVIFCHQEESNWPLEDGKKLKDRFDEIFDTSQYNKAMDTTTKLIKDLQSELNGLRGYEEGLKAIVEEVENQEEKLRESERREQEAKNRLIEIDGSTGTLEQKMKEIGKIGEDYDKLQNRIKKLETDYEVTQNYIESWKKVIKIFHKGSKEELVKTINDFDTNFTQKVTEKTKHEEKLRLVEERKIQLEEELADARIKLGSLKQKKIAFDEKVSRRNKLLANALEIWEISQLDSTFSEEEVKGHFKEIEEKIENSAKDLTEIIKDHEQEQKHVQKEVDGHRTVKSGIESEISLKDKERQEIKTEINLLREKIKETGEAGNRLSSVESNLENARKKYDALIQSFDENAEKEKLLAKIAAKKELQQKSSQIDQEISSLHHQSTQQAELELHQTRLSEKEKNISSLKEKHRSDLHELFDGKIPETNWKENLEKMHISLLNEKKSYSSQIEAEQKKLTTLKTTLKYKDNELSKTEAELKRLKEKVNTGCQGIEYEELLSLQERKVKDLQDRRGIYANQSLMYEEYLKQLRNKRCCPLCDRDFESSDAKKMEDKLISEIKKSPQSLQNCEKELRREQMRYDALQQLKPITEQIKEIKNEKLPKIITLVEQIKNDVENSEGELENLEIGSSVPEEKLNIHKKIYGDLILLDSYISEKDSLRKLIERKEREMQKAGKIGNRSMQEAQNENQALKKRLTDVEQDIEKIQITLQENQEKIQKAREHKNKLNEEVIQIRQNMQVLKQLKDKVKELYERENFLDKSMTSLRQEAVYAEQKLNAKVDELEDMKKEHRKIQTEKTTFNSERSTEICELKRVQAEVCEFITNRIDKSLQQVETVVEKIQKEYDVKKAEKSDLDDKIRFLDEQCNSQEASKKDLKLNLDLLDKKESFEVINEKLLKHKKTLRDMKFEELEREYQQLKDQKNRYEKEKNEIRGAQGELENSIRTIKRNLNQEKYRMARRNHKEKQLQLVVQEEAIANLKSYATVLDKAMIQFHEERMNTVNKIMRQLWNLVYSGNDTSSIQIRVQTTEGIGDKKRSYNYKLVQVKRNTEMDMKGKCSAGQKVLASIIIRMALAETFCSDCAVLALDEPTTNLDEENAKNLAVTLSKVIQLRARDHKNFQLIVISHDEKFISHLSNLSGKQMFQELFRNVDGYSEVRKRDMSEYTKNNSQSVNDDKYDDYTEDEDEDIKIVEPTNSKTKKRILSLDDSPPSRPAKRKAYF